jgi:hypothetical protein
MVNVKRLNHKVRKEIHSGLKPGLEWEAYFPPSSSLAMVANCMLDVPS